jgi:YidC/Oxa1 family membrane protein insertase
MDNLRFILLASLAFVGFLLWQGWQNEHPNQNGAHTQQTQSDIKNDERPVLPTASNDRPVATIRGENLAQGNKIRIETDVYQAEISTIGGDLRNLALHKYPLEVNKPEQPYPLLTEDADNLAVLQGGLLSGQGAPDHHAVYQAEQGAYRLAEGSDQLVVPLSWKGGNGLEVIKRYTFHRGEYQVDVSYEVHNNSAQAWRGRLYEQIQRRVVSKDSHFFARTYSGAAYYDGTYHKLPFKDFAQNTLHEEIQNGWAAVIEHYFVAAVIPPTAAKNFYYTKALPDSRYLVGVTSADVEVAPGAQATLEDRLYLGPKEQDRLAAVAPGFDLTVDYGRLTIIAAPLFKVLHWLYGWVGNWGWSIVLVTLMIRLAFYKLAESQYKSMAKMRQFAPRIQALRERYGDDKQKLNEAMMELYRKEKFNPLGGCLPLFIQLPVFISLYWVLLESVELRHAPFILWIKDLSTHDPYYVLPILFGLTQFLQQRLSANPAMDPMQQRVMMFMPIALTGFFIFFPAGLVLYWLVNNLLSIAQQWYITRKYDETAGKAAKPA